MNVLEHQTNNVPILVTFTGTTVTGLTAPALTVKMADALGVVEDWTSGDYDLTEVDASAFPGRYVITNYPEVDIIASYLTKQPGKALLSISGASIDTLIEEVRVGEELAQSRALYRYAYERLEWNADESRWDLYDENDDLIGYFAARDVNDGEAVIDGTHPVTRLAFVGV